MNTKQPYCWYRSQTSHNIPLSQNLIQGKTLTLFNSIEVEKCEEGAEEKSGISKGWFLRFKDRQCLHHIKVYDGLGVVAQACISSTLGGRGRQITWGQEFETSLAKMVKPCLN